MKGAIYARVSSEMQRDNFSIMAQLSEIRQYCLKNSIEIYEEYIDDGYTSRNANRPAFKKMIAEAEQNNFEMILVHEFSRFASNSELSKSLEEKLKKSNVTVISITEPVDNSPSGFFQRLIMRGLAEWRLLNLAEHIKKSQKYMVSEKGLNHGASCYGYRMIDKKLVIDKQEAEVVKQIFDLYIEGYGCQKISNYLRENNIRTRRGKYFEFFQITHILKNVKYIGKLKYGEIIADGQHEAIIPEKNFEIVQSELKRKNSNKFKNLDGGAGISRRSMRWYNFYLLSILYCGECGSNMRIIHSSNRTKYYYSCGRAMRYTGVCEYTKAYEVNKIEKEIENILHDYMIGEVEIIAKANYSDTKKEILMRRFNKIPLEITRVQEAFIGGLIDIDIAKVKKDKLESELIQVEKELNDMKNNTLHDSDIKNNIKNIWDVFIHENDVCRKREILKQVIDKIYMFKDGHCEIIFQAD